MKYETMSAIYQKLISSYMKIITDNDCSNSYDKSNDIKNE